MKFAEILRQNQELGKLLTGDPYPIAVLSNIVAHQFTPIIECILRAQGVNATVVEGGYDNIIQDSMVLKDAKLVVVLWELANMVPGLAVRAQLFRADERDALVRKLQADLESVLISLRRFPLVVVTTFSDAPFSVPSLRPTALGDIATALNETLRRSVGDNVYSVSIDRLYAELSLERSFDYRAFASAKAPYTVGFFKAFADVVSSSVLSATGRGKKALVFDCDNTLWQGIVGEDGIETVRMDAETTPGKYFHEIQCLAKDLARRGVILGLCSKNNEGDVAKLFASGRMPLTQDDIAISRVNWNDKVSNLVEIARALNIGLDSVVFVDDSPFETNLVRERLPEVDVVEVPNRLELYAPLLRRVARGFFSPIQAEEDRQRGRMLRESEHRSAELVKYERIEDYIRSLDLQLKVFRNSELLISRVAQLTQKTNQFNLTTKRYSESEIRTLIASETNHVFAVAVKDRFGDYGLTGVCIALPTKKTDEFEIDTFLLSCRVLGRNIELVFLEYVVNFLVSLSVKVVDATFSATPKNSQVADFYDRAGFSVVERTAASVRYRLEGRIFTSGINYIRLQHE